MTSVQTKLTQSIQAGLFDAAEPAPVLLQVVDLSFDEKVKAAVVAIKQQVREGRREPPRVSRRLLCLSQAATGIAV
ncbi:hypothetical protein ACIOWK_32120 [Pseudomonas protegens]|uniref:hypothetical protein n=1 Tax=Pseudomonas protegens TaxID=380021 RepID=UPI003821842D